ncbi:uncharacterized protein [Bemisia tabaci]
MVFQRWNLDMERIWHSTSKTSGRVVLLAIWLSIIPWFCSAQSWKKLDDARYSDGSDDVSVEESVSKNASLYLDRSVVGDDFNIELNFFRWGTCQRADLSKSLKCCETDINTDEDRRYYACEDIPADTASKFVRARLEVGDLQRSLMSRYNREVNSLFNASENPAWAEVSRRPIGELGDVPFSYFLGRPVEGLLRRALNRSLEESLDPANDRRRIEKRLQDLRQAVSAALNHTLNDIVNESLDYVFQLDDQDFDYVSGRQWFRIRNLSLENIFDSMLQANGANMTGVETLLRIAWRLFLNQQQESFEKFLSNPGEVVAWIFNTYMNLFGNNRTGIFNREALRGFVQYYTATESYRVTIPLCYAPIPASSLCWNINFMINTNKWTVRKTVNLAAESSLLAADSFVLELFDLDLNLTGFRERRQEGVCADGRISLLDMDGYPFPKFELGCHPVFYHPLQYVDQVLCLLYERTATSRNSHRNTTLGKVCIDPIQATLMHELTRNFIRMTVRNNNLQPSSNKVCKNMVYQLHTLGTGTPRDELMSRAITEMLSYSITNLLGVRSDRRTILNFVRLSRAAPILMDAWGAIAQNSNSTEQFNRNLMECGVLLLQHGEEHRTLALHPTPPPQPPTSPPNRLRDLLRRRISDHRLAPPAPSSNRRIRQVDDLEMSQWDDMSGTQEEGQIGDPRDDDIPAIQQIQGQSALNNSLAALFRQLDEMRFRLRDFLDGQRVNFESRLDGLWDRYANTIRAWLESFLARVLGTVTQYAPLITRHPG